MLFEREQIEDALKQVALKLTERGLSGRLNVIGGAALSLHYFDRDVTVDIDSVMQPRGELIEVTDEIALENGWPAEWLNDKAKQFIPQFGADIEWVPVRRFGVLDVYVAPADLLLAMKVRASRQKDIEDISWLIKELGLHDVDAVDAIIEKYWPGEHLDPRALKIVQAVLAQAD